MSRKPVTNPGPVLEQLSAFRRDVVLPLLAKLPPTHPQAARARALNGSILALADELAGKKDVLLGEGHRSSGHG